MSAIKLVSVTHKASDYHLHHEWQWLAVITSHWFHQLLPMGGDSFTVQCLKLRANNNAKLCIPSFYHISGSNGNTQSSCQHVTNSRLLRRSVLELHVCFLKRHLSQNKWPLIVFSCLICDSLVHLFSINQLYIWTNALSFHISNCTELTCWSKRAVPRSRRCTEILSCCLVSVPRDLAPINASEPPIQLNQFSLSHVQLLSTPRINPTPA
jgi:hypothetical protein